MKVARCVTEVKGICSAPCARVHVMYPCTLYCRSFHLQDVATRLFLRRLKRELNIPVMGLVDSDPYGLKILSVYMSGETQSCDSRYDRKLQIASA